MDQELQSVQREMTSHALGRLEDSRRTQLPAASSGRRVMAAILKI